MEQSILTSTKKILGLAEEYTAFDLDVITHINTAFSVLTQLGIGPPQGFAIESAETEWSEYLDPYDINFTAVKTYVYLKARQLFDPPTTSYMIMAQERQIQELEWRLNVFREETEWVDPDPPVILIPPEEAA